MKLFKQFLQFGIVGVICFVIDYGLMIILTEYIGIDYLLSCALSFIISTTANYYLSKRYVFEFKRNKNMTIEFILFVLLSSVGLGLTETLMFTFVDKFGLYYMFSKIIVTGIVMFYNFLTRKIILEKA